jgi:hypothetical protein
MIATPLYRPSEATPRSPGTRTARAGALQDGQDVVPQALALPHPVLRGRGHHAAAEEIGHRGRVAGRPGVLEALDPEIRVGPDPTRVVDREPGLARER